MHNFIVFSQTPAQHFYDMKWKKRRSESIYIVYVTGTLIEQVKASFVHFSWYLETTVAKLGVLFSTLFHIKSIKKQIRKTRLGLISTLTWFYKPNR